MFRLQPCVFVKGQKKPVKSVKEIMKVLQSAKTTVKTSAPKQDILYEILLMEGWDLCSEIREEKIGTNLFYQIKSGSKKMLVCVDKKISSRATEWLVDHAPNCPIICPDSALNDRQKIILSSQVRLKTV